MFELREARRRVVDRQPRRLISNRLGTRRSCESRRDEALLVVFERSHRVARLDRMRSSRFWLDLRIRCRHGGALHSTIRRSRRIARDGQRGRRRSGFGVPLLDRRLRLGGLVLIGPRLGHCRFMGRLFVWRRSHSRARIRHLDDLFLLEADRARRRSGFASRAASIRNRCAQTRTLRQALEIAAHDIASPLARAM